MVSARDDFVAQIDGEGVLGLHVVEAGEDEAKGFLRARTRLGNRFGLVTGRPRERSDGQGS